MRGVMTTLLKVKRRNSRRDPKCLIRPKNRYKAGMQ